MQALVLETIVCCVLLPDTISATRASFSPLFLVRVHARKIWFP